MKKTTKDVVKKSGEAVENLPVYCDFSCRFASFAPADSVGACRRDQAVYCKLLRQYNSKNSRCAARRS